MTSEELEALFQASPGSPAPAPTPDDLEALISQAPISDPGALPSDVPRLPGEAPAQMRTAPDGPSLMKSLQFLAAGLNQGASMGAGDELGAMAGQGEGDTVEERRQSIIRPYEAMKESSTANRIAGSVAELGGGVISGMGIPGLVRAAFPSLAGAAANFVERGGTAANQFLRRTGLLGGTGAAQGGAIGAGTAEPGERLEGAEQGAGISGIIGAAIPGAGKVVQEVGSVARTVASGSKNAAERRFGKKVAESGLTPEGLAEKARTIGGPVMAGDLTPGLQRELEVVVARPGTGSQIAEEALTKRQEGASKRIRETLVKVIGGGQNWREAMKKLGKESDDVVSPLYKEIEGMPVNISQEFMNTSAVLPALKQATRIARDNLRNTGNVAEIEAIEEAIRARAPVTVPLRIADSTKKILYDMEQKRKLTGGLSSPKATEESKAITGVRRDFLQSIDDQLGGNDPAKNPYLRARRLSQGFQKDKEAIQIGRQFEKYEIEDLQQKVSEMSESERSHLRLGLVLNLRTKVGRGSDKRAHLNLGGDTNIKVKIMMGPDYPVVGKYLDEETLMRFTENKAMAGSPTARRELGAQEQKDSERGAAQAADLITQQPADSLLGFYNKAKEKAFGPSASQNEALARMLTTQGPDDIGAMLSRYTGAPAQGEYVLSPRMREAIRRLLPMAPQQLEAEQ